MLRVVHNSHVISTGDGSEAATTVELHLSGVVTKPPTLPLISLQDACRHRLLLQLKDLHMQNTGNVSGTNTSSICLHIPYDPIIWRGKK